MKPPLISQLSSLPKENHEISAETKVKMWESAKKFEGYFVGFIFEQAYQSIPKSDFLGGSQQEMYTGMFIQQLSDQMTHSPRGIGLASQIYRDLEKHALSSAAKHPLQSSSGTDARSINSKLDAVSGTDLAQIGLKALQGRGSGQ